MGKNVNSYSLSVNREKAKGIEQEKDEHRTPAGSAAI